jgi:tetrahydromethanopterin S-methyltransferase subunit B
MLKDLFALMTILFVAASSPVATNCDTNSVFKVEETRVVYEVPPVNSTLIVSYTVPEKIEDGLATYKCTLNGIPVMNEQAPLCQETVCPIETGFHNDSSSFQTGLATGTLSCTLKWLATDSSVLRCIRIVETS